MNIAVLKPCLECGERISRKAEACPHCGIPIKKQSSALAGWGIIIFLFIVVAALISCLENNPSDKPERGKTTKTKFTPNEWYWFTGPEPDFTGKVIVAREYSGSLGSCVTNFFILAQDIAGEKAVLDHPAILGAAPIPSRLVSLDGKEIADIGCMEGLQTVTATPQVASRLRPKLKNK